MINFEEQLSDSDAVKLLDDGLMNLGDVETIELVFNDILAPLMYGDVGRDTFLLLAYRLTLRKNGIPLTDGRMLELHALGPAIYKQAIKVTTN